MKYLLSVWTDETFTPIQLNCTAYDRYGTLLAMSTWSTSTNGLANAIYEVAERVAEMALCEQDRLFDAPAE